VVLDDLGQFIPPVGRSWSPTLHNNERWDTTTELLVTALSARAREMFEHLFRGAFSALEDLTDFSLTVARYFKEMLWFVRSHLSLSLPG